MLKISHLPEERIINVPRRMQRSKLFFNAFLLRAFSVIGGFPCNFTDFIDFSGEKIDLIPDKWPLISTVTEKLND